MEGVAGLISWILEQKDLFERGSKIAVSVRKILNSLDIRRTYLILNKRSVDFRQLTKFQTRFHGEVLKFLAKALNVQKQGSRTTSPNMDDLMDSYLDYMKAICNTGASAISHAKPSSYKITCNIKVICPSPNSAKSEMCYYILTRSDGSSEDRYDIDDNIYYNPMPIKKHKIYSFLVDPNVSDTHYLEKDFERLIKDVEKQSPKIFDEPSRKDKAFYRSFLTVLIKGHHVVRRKDMQNLRVTMPYYAEDIFGFLCVDSDGVDMFNNDGDRDILNQLSHYVYSASSTLYALSVMLPPKKALHVKHQLPRSF